MPVTHWFWQPALDGEEQSANTVTLIAEIGSLTLEFTRLSQITGNPKYYDATARIMMEFERSQSKTKIPGLWPTTVNAKELSFDSSSFTLGGMADSLYEYLPKQHMLLSGKGDIDYRSMYKFAITAAMNHIFFQPMVPDNADILFSGSADVISSADSAVNDKEDAENSKKIILRPDAEHLGCYAGRYN